MRKGHRDAQILFLGLGRRLGYRSAKSFSRRWPTDGVWYAPGRDDLSIDLPVAAVEVLVSESPKTTRGSIGVLEAVSPALGILLVQEEDIARRMRLAGREEEEIQRYFTRLVGNLQSEIDRVHQRIEIWTYSQLVRRHELVNNNGRTSAA